MDSGFVSMETIESRLQWSRTRYSLRDFIAQRKDTLPAIVRVTEGYSGDDGDDSHDIATGTVLFVYAIDVQSRVIAQTEDDHYLSFAGSCPLFFHVILNDGSLSRASTLNEIVQRERNNIGDVRIRMSSPVDGGLGPTDAGYSDIQGVLRVLDLFDEKYLLCHPLCGDKFRSCDVISVPSYLPLSVVVARGWRVASKADFREFLNDVSASGHVFQRRYSEEPRSCEEIVVFSDLPNGDYELIPPSSVQMSRLPSFKVFDKKKTKAGADESALDPGAPSSLPSLPPRKLSGGWMSMDNVSTSNSGSSMTSQIARRPLPPVPGGTETENGLREEEAKKIQTSEESMILNRKKKSSVKNLFSFVKEASLSPPKELPVKNSAEKEVRKSPMLSVRSEKWSPKSSERKQSKGGSGMSPAMRPNKPVRRQNVRFAREFPVNSKIEDVLKQSESEVGFSDSKQEVDGNGSEETTGSELKISPCQNLKSLAETSESRSGLDAKSYQQMEQRDTLTAASSSSWNFAQKTEDPTTSSSRSDKPRPTVAKKPNFQPITTPITSVQPRRTSLGISMKQPVVDLSDSGLSSSSLGASCDPLPAVPWDGLVSEGETGDGQESFYDEIHSPQGKTDSSDLDQSSGTYPETPDQDSGCASMILRKNLSGRSFEVQSLTVAQNKVDNFMNAELNMDKKSDSENEEMDTSYEEICFLPSHRKSSAPEPLPSSMVEPLHLSVTSTTCPNVPKHLPPTKPIQKSESKSYSTTCENADAVSLHEEVAPRPALLLTTKQSWRSTDEVPTDISGLSVDQVSACLNILNLGQYVRSFREHQIDGALLSCLDKDVLISDFRFRNFEAIKLVKFARDGWRPRMEHSDTSA